MFIGDVVASLSISRHDNEEHHEDDDNDDGNEDAHADAGHRADVADVSCRRSGKKGDLISSIELLNFLPLLSPLTDTLRLDAPRPEAILATPSRLVADQSVAVIAAEADQCAHPVPILRLAAVHRLWQGRTAHL